MEFIDRIKGEEQYAPMGDFDTVPSKPKVPVLKSLLERGFTREMFEKWDVVWDEDRGAMRIPIMSKRGDLQGRIWRYPEGVNPKYKYETGFQRSETLYGLWRLGTVVTDVVLVEGPLDAIWVQEAGLSGLAILGSSLSETQAQIVRRLKAKRVLLCFDNDPAGSLAAQKATGLLKQYGCWVYRVKLGKRWNDIQEVPIDKVPKILANIELSVNGSGMIHHKFKRWTGATKANDKGIWRK